MTTDIGYPATPGLAHAVERLSKAYDNAEKRQDERVKRMLLNAAAPDLLAAGERLLEWIELGCDPSNKSIEAMRAAIAKATGATVPADLAEACAGYRCGDCGREESDCSADPCAAVMADREA